MKYFCFLLTLKQANAFYDFTLMEHLTHLYILTITTMVHRGAEITEASAKQRNVIQLW